MKDSFKKILQGYQSFREKYAVGDNSVMQYLSHYGQKPQVMVVSCCDSRVDPAVIFQCDPGDLFVVRNVANIIPPFEQDTRHHGTSAALEFGICFLEIRHLVLLGHSQCGGIQVLVDHHTPQKNDFITNWVSLIESEHSHDADDYAKFALNTSLQNCFTFPWIKDKVLQNKLTLHQWFFDVKKGQIFTCENSQEGYLPLEDLLLSQLTTKK